MATRKSRSALSNGGRSFLRHSDRLSGIILILVAGFAIFEASHLPFGSVRAPDAGFFPISLSVLLLVVAVIIVLGSYISEPKQPEFTARAWYVAIAAAALVVYALVLQTVGFLIATIVILLLMMRGFGGMSWTRALLIAISGVLVSYFGFLELGVPLPQGFLPF
jgi:putative tricarboxylic transport membrane protein